MNPNRGKVVFSKISPSQILLKDKNDKYWVVSRASVKLENPFPSAAMLVAAMFVAITIVSRIDTLNYAKHVHLRSNVEGRGRIPSKRTVFPNHFNPFWLIEFPACEWGNRGFLSRSRVRAFWLGEIPSSLSSKFAFQFEFRGDNAYGFRKTRICPRSCAINGIM